MAEAFAAQMAAVMEANFKRLAAEEAKLAAARQQTVDREAAAAERERAAVEREKAAAERETAAAESQRRAAASVAAASVAAASVAAGSVAAASVAAASVAASSVAAGSVAGASVAAVAEGTGAAVGAGVAATTVRARELETQYQKKVGRVLGHGSAERLGSKRYETVESKSEFALRQMASRSAVANVAGASAEDVAELQGELMGVAVRRPDSSGGRAGEVVGVQAAPSRYAEEPGAAEVETRGRAYWVTVEWQAGGDSPSKARQSYDEVEFAALVGPDVYKYVHLEEAAIAADQFDLYEARARGAAVGG